MQALCLMLSKTYIYYAQNYAGIYSRPGPTLGLPGPLISTIIINHHIIINYNYAESIINYTESIKLIYSH